ncbi:MAG: helix-turn-helix transcriptional regulator [Bacilli bacterium]
MNKNLTTYFVELIKTKRKEKELSLENISVLVSIDKGYLSKIENRIVYPSPEILASILNEFGIKLIFEESILNQMSEKLDKLYFDIVYLNQIDHEYINKTIFSQEDLYSSSFIFDKYLVIKYVYLVTTKKKRELISSVEEIIEAKLIKFNIMNSDLLQVYYDYKGTALKNESKLEEALEVYEKCKSLGYYKYSYGMVCYHMAIVYISLNNNLAAYTNVKESLMIFVQEYNLKRQQYSQIHLANIYSVSKQYIKADSIYRSLMIGNAEKEFKYLVHINLIWNLIKQDKYLLAIDELMIVEEKYTVQLKWYYFLSWCYYKTNQFNYSLEIIESIDSTNLNDSIDWSKIKVIKLLITESDKREMIKMIKDEYQIKQMIMNNEDKKFFLEILVEEYSKILCYKEVNKYQDSLLKLLS